MTKPAMILVSDDGRLFINGAWPLSCSYWSTRLPIFLDYLDFSQGRRGLFTSAPKLGRRRDDTSGLSSG